MNYTKSQLVEYAGITPNVATTWLREGVLEPLKIEGRNNRFDTVEMQVARILAAPYDEWGLPAAALRQVGELLRGYLGKFKALGFATQEEAKRAHALYRFHERANDDFVRDAREKGGDYWRGVCEVMKLDAEKLGILDWEKTPEPELTKDQYDELSGLIALLGGIKGGFGTISVGKSEDSWWVSFEMDQDKTGSDGKRSLSAYVPDYFVGKSMIVIDLSRVFGG